MRRRDRDLVEVLRGGIEDGGLIERLRAGRAFLSA